MTSDENPWVRREWGLVVCLFLFALATRWPLRSIALEEFDSANYALALQKIDLEKHAPHPPGYIFFIWTARVARMFTGDEVSALTAVNAVSGALSAALLYGLLRLGMSPALALAATVVSMLSAQVWFQQVRPMEDAYAFAWLLVVAYAFVRSWRQERGWLLAMLVLGVSGGAKQILLVFLIGLIGRTLFVHLQERRFALAVSGILLVWVGSLTWLLPLSIRLGSLRGYLEWALGQAFWQRHEALLTGLVFPGLWERLQGQWTETFVIPAGGAWPAVALWGLAALGILSVARHDGPRWLVWLVVPVVVLRFLVLGPWPRFTIYYLPFIIGLASLGLGALFKFLERSLRLSRGYWRGLGAAMALLFVFLQVRFILPTLLLLHRARSPVGQAVEFARAHYDPKTTLIIADQALISRHAEYYAPRQGFDYMFEPFVSPGMIGGRTKVLTLAHGNAARLPSGWVGGIESVASWREDIPHWGDLSFTDEMWQVGLYELTGTHLIYRGWVKEDPQGAGGARLAQREGSVLVLLRAPPQGLEIRLTGMSKLSGPPGASFLINRRHVVEWDGSTEDFSLRIPSEEVLEGRVQVEIKTNCGGGRAPRRCLRLSGVEILAR